MLRTRVLRAVVLSFVLLFVAGCTSVPEAKAIVGRWAYSSDLSPYEADGRDGRIVFDADGTFVANFIPFEALVPGAFFGEVSPGMNSTDSAPMFGTWSVVEERFGVNTPAVELDIEPIDALPGVPNGFTTHLEVRGSGNSMTLFIYLGDPDLGNRYILTKKTD